MKTFFTTILVILLSIGFMSAWILADDRYRTVEIQRNFSTSVTETAEKDEPREITLLFGGDLVLDPNHSVFTGAGSAGACIDKDLLSEMRSADVFMLGHAFALTEGGTPLEKTSLFRAATKDSAVLTELSVDVVSLANNHSFDYSYDGLKDTLNTLDSIKIAHVGAGLEEVEATKPYYVEIGGKRIAFTAAMRSEVYAETPAATQTEAGVAKMYDLESYLETIRTAKENADIVVAYAHWGVENTIWLESEQLDGARAMIDAGADIVVGAHSHTLQTVEVYRGKPIFYGLGDISGEGGLAKITVSKDGTISAKVIPFSAASGVISPLSGEALDFKIERLNFVAKSVESIAKNTVAKDGSLVK